MELDDLVDRGLGIVNRDRALRYLRHIGYYRLSPWTIPFQQGGPEHRLRDGASFDDVLDLYVFDRALRLVIVDALERVEVAVRAALYPVLVSLQTVLETMSPPSGWAQRLHELVDSRPSMNLRGMGIPDDWADEPFWHRHLD